MIASVPAADPRHARRRRASNFSPFAEIPHVPNVYTSRNLRLLGQDLAGNPTQYMIEKTFAHHGLDWRYLTLQVAPADLRDAIRGMRALGFRGGNITKPHKVPVVEHLDRLSEAAALIGAVNCIVRDGDQLVGRKHRRQRLSAIAPRLDRPARQARGAAGGRRGGPRDRRRAGAGRRRDRSRSSIARPSGARRWSQRLLEKTTTPAARLPWEGDFRRAGRRRRADQRHARSA